MINCIVLGLSRRKDNRDGNMKLLDLITDKLLSLFNNLNETGLYILLGSSLVVALILYVL